MNYSIAIPSHRRAELFEKKTLEYLRATDVDLSRVFVFVSDAADKAAYEARGLGVRIVHERDIANVTEKFNLIHDHFAPGERVVVMEDDISLVTGSKDSNAERGPLTKLHAAIVAGFDQIPHGGIWGIAPHSNSFYFSGKVTRTLKLAVAHAFGFVSTRDPWLAVTQRGKSDYERTCRYFVRYGEVIRLDYIGVKTTSYTQAGGMQSDHSRTERAAFEHASCEWLERHFPHLIEINPHKKSLFTELRFKRCSMDRDELAAYQNVVEEALAATW